MNFRSHGNHIEWKQISVPSLSKMTRDAFFLFSGTDCGVRTLFTVALCLRCALCSLMSVVFVYDLLGPTRQLGTEKIDTYFLKNDHTKPFTASLP